MCFSVNVNLVKEEIENRYGVNFPDKYRYEPSYYYHAFGLPEITGICSGRISQVCLLKWGLIPSWVRDEEEAKEIRFKTFNARAETLAERPSFSPSLSSKRCIIPVKGFYEWQHVGKDRIPWFIYSNDGTLLSLAGLYSEWVNNNEDKIENTFTIITTEANEMMAGVHNSKKRMPAVLIGGAEKEWLDLTIKPADASAVLRPAPDGYLKAHTISPLINNRKENRNTPDIIRPYSYHSGNLF